MSELVDCLNSLSAPATFLCGVIVGGASLFMTVLLVTDLFDPVWRRRRILPAILWGVLSLAGLLAVWGVFS